MVFSYVFAFIFLLSILIFVHELGPLPRGKGCAVSAC